MKRYYILIILAFVATLVSCNNDVNTTEEWGDITIPLDPSKHYIHFDADVNTRGTLIEGTVLQDNFYALGYQYRGNWEAASVLASPNVFYKADGTTAQIPQEITHNNGVFTYSPIQAWSGNTYSFFGYYPTNNNLIKLFDDGTVKQGEPYSTYSLPNPLSISAMVDVMTASYKDTGVASSNQVSLQFHHRLSAIDVGARNYYEHELEDGTIVPVTIEIVDLDINISNIQSTSARIPLDPSKAVIPNPANSKAGEVSFPMVGPNISWAPESISIKPNTADDRGMRPIVKDPKQPNTASIILIPQYESITGDINLVYMRKYEDSNGNWLYNHVDGDWRTLPDNQDQWVYFKFDAANNAENNMNINFNKPLIEGRRYYIELTFTSDAISVNIVAADEWNELDKNVDYEFE